MRLVQLTLGIATLALAVASAASHYNLKLDAVQWAGSKELKPGDYKVELTGDKAVFTTGKTVIEVPAVIQKSGKKFSATTYQASGSKIVEIDLGGTNTKLVFGTAAGGASSSHQ
jgi:hypothetical protein